MKIFYVYRTPRKSILENVKRKVEPDHYLYGYQYLKENGFEVSFSDDYFKKSVFFRWIFKPLELLLIKKTSIGFDLGQAVILLPKMNKADLIITTTDSVGLPVLLLKKLKLLNKPIVHISTGLVNEIGERINSCISRFYLRLISQSKVIVCHSDMERNLYIKLVPSIKEKIYTIPFAVDSQFFICARKLPKFILSVGRDRSRNFHFLSKIAKYFPNKKFVVVTSKPNVKNILFPKNVEVFLDLPYTTIKEFYCQSKLIFIPMREINRASGQTAFLEAIASGNKVVIAKVKGIVQVYSDLIKENKNIYLYKPGNYKSALKSIRAALNSKPIKYFLPDVYQSKSYAKKLKELFTSI